MIDWNLILSLQLPQKVKKHKDERETLRYLENMKNGIRKIKEKLKNTWKTWSIGILRAAFDAFYILECPFTSESKERNKSRDVKVSKILNTWK